MVTSIAHRCQSRNYIIEMPKTVIQSLHRHILLLVVYFRITKFASLHTLPDFSSRYSVYLENSSSSGSLGHKLLIFGSPTHNLDLLELHSVMDMK